MNNPVQAVREGAVCSERSAANGKREGEDYDVNYIFPVMFKFIPAYFKEKTLERAREPQIERINSCMASVSRG